ncbi:MAG: hypothetical protein A3A88_10270 [Nitrospirae bacterium RIFCSPLOWO2_01_FULL_62_17]|nr:MAG: hypothetical protein A3A88_10270 [Nitrospirae bacterium RIFCSPLOWO2_01_FULL_62_17]
MLNDAQRTSLGIVMRMLEEKMRAVEARLASPEEQALTFEIRNDLTPAMVQVLREKIDEVYALIRALCDRFALPPDVKPASRDALTGLMPLWVVLQESTSERLRRYGEVDPSLAHVLDPNIDALARLMVEMDDAARSDAQVMSANGVKKGPA